MKLHQLVTASASKNERALAVKDPRRSLSYGELDRLANQIAWELNELGVRQGDRVGIWREKSVEMVAAMQGILRTGAAYVPLDPLSPATRIRSIIDDCAMSALISSTARGRTVLPAAVPCLDVSSAGLEARSDAPFPTPPIGDHDLAYILYTSGSTGKPKGVSISQQNSLAFIDWAQRELEITSADRLSNHAPFHFDLSVLDLYCAFFAGAAVYLIPEIASYAPKGLVELLVAERITVWYSVPTALIMMMTSGGLLEIPENPLRAICFAGEPFPIQHLRRLFERWPAPRVRYLNLYGPTETNVCTAYEVKSLDPERTKPVPIGAACSGDTVWAETADGTKAAIGEEGELLVSGPTVLLGYWGREPHGDRPYRTGDRVRLLDEDGNYEYLGRRDQLVKVHGYRIELGDIEAALAQHPQVHETAVMVTGEGIEARLVAFVVAKVNQTAPHLLELKKHCSERLPRYMIIDDVIAVAALPRTATGKIDRLALKG